MPHIPYADPASITDPEILGYLELARKEGTPRPESQAIRANHPNVIRAFSQAWELTFRQGVCDHSLKELCRVYVSKSIDCDYWGVQRSVQAGRKGLTEDKYDDLLNFTESNKFSEREKVALTYTSAIIWNSEIADDALWEKLHQHFTTEELVELGFFIALTLGQQRWIKTLGIGHGEVLGDNTIGLAPTVTGSMSAGQVDRSKGWRDGSDVPCERLLASCAEWHHNPAAVISNEVRDLPLREPLPFWVIVDRSRAEL
jgi:alkylhydroperoxidase family enzyme